MNFVKRCRQPYPWQSPRTSKKLGYCTKRYLWRWTQQIPHYKLVVTSLVEGGHATMKAWKKGVHWWHHNSLWEADAASYPATSRNQPRHWFPEGSSVVETSTKILVWCSKEGIASSPQRSFHKISTGSSVACRCSALHRYAHQGHGDTMRACNKAETRQ